MKTVCLMLLALLGMGLATTEASVETWPTKPVRAIVPYSAGSTTDIVPRVCSNNSPLSSGSAS